MRILVVKLSSLGDLFHALPAVAAIKKNGNPLIDWVTHPAYVDLVRQFEPVDRVIAFPRKKFITRAVPFFRELWQEKYDYIFDMQGLLKSAFVARCARGGQRIGPSFHREGSRIFYSAVTGPRNKERHAVEENLDLLDYLGLPRDTVEFPVRWPRPSDLPAGPKIALLPCSRWETKNWPVEHFVETARMLAPEAQVHVFGSPDDAATCRQIEAAAPGIINHCGATSMLELGGYLSVMDLVITVDSGPMHIAAASGTPVLALFGPTNHRRTGPYGAKHHILFQEHLACRPCLSRSCRLPAADVRCLRDIGPSNVVAKARAMLAGKIAG